MFIQLQHHNFRIRKGSPKLVVLSIECIAAALAAAGNKAQSDVHSSNSLKHNSTRRLHPVETRT